MAEWTQQGDTFILRDATVVRAPIERCFAMTCSIALVKEELGMDPVAGRTEGLVTANDTVRWEGWQLGLKHFHVSRISAYQQPVFLQDSMLAGRFKSFQHDHHLRELPGGAGTELRDELRFTLPFGALGRLVARYIMVPHILRLMKSRFARLKRYSEGDGWQRYLPAPEAASDEAREVAQ